ncbi:fructosamine kinase family protein [Lacibacter sediminis]|uniref:Fructosamine kinase family protein n=1 Tax=Lacibacter sediminis TaxID=2760713 RepID=A0A7G5XKM5_9BACT|nr:fructosamine kinase family protein [Lacibacter sediminis]QNA46028.1 fructosamine kinase family protein [Lacibacter sediminis]
MNSSLKNILLQCGFDDVQMQTVAGGDINRAYKIFTGNTSFFLKVNDAAAYPLMFQREADGLEALKKYSHCIIPNVVKTGVADDQQYLLLQWIERAAPAKDYYSSLGKSLAEMHLQPQTQCGWQVDNYMGSLPQHNMFTDDWCSFYAMHRIAPLVKVLTDAGRFGSKQQQQAERLYRKLSQYFPNEKPAFLHGDLWGGNHFPNENGLPVLIDPAVYCGHREMDIGMTALFGGFDHSFYEAYQYHYPLESGWQQRLQLTQLYPVLVHAVLFGGHYTAQASSILELFAA